MLSLICLVFTILISALGVQGSGTHHIVGGTGAKQCEFPHMVFILVYREGKLFTCGGSLIDEKHVLTAAHCLRGTVKRVDVSIGSVDRKKFPMEMSVLHFIKHPGFKIPPATVLNDVAVLTLPKPVTFTSCIKPIRMANPGEKFVGNCTIAGWGKTGRFLPSSNLLLRADIPLMNKARCTREHPMTSEQHICAGLGRLNEKTTCMGDSGGPLMCTSATDEVRVLAGVVSYGWNCISGSAIFAKVSYFLPWINSVRRS